MGEKQKYIVKKISYEGFFSFREVFRIMDWWMRDKFYDKHEKKTEEQTKPTGKQLDYEFTPWKKYTDYHKGIIKIEVIAQNLKEVDVVIRGEKRRMQHGKLNIKLTGYLIVDYENLWERTALLTFLRDIFDKYFHWYITKKYSNMIVDHVNDLYYAVSSYLNTTQYKIET